LGKRVGGWLGWDFESERSTEAFFQKDSKSWVGADRNVVEFVLQEA
jgi:hypothetical protein